MERIRIDGPDNLWAEILDEGNQLVIVDGYNLGQISQAILFPTLPTVKWFLAGKWSISVNEMLETHGPAPKTTEQIDGQITKVIRQWWRGMLLADEMIGQLARLQMEDNEGKDRLF